MSIPSCRTTFTNRCYLTCPSNYRLATYPYGGAFMQYYSRTNFINFNYVQCQGNARWTNYNTLPSVYCRRRNDPPTDLKLDSTTFNEGSPIGTVVGRFSSSDQQPGTRFTYSLQRDSTSTGYYLFRVSGTQLLSRWVPRLNQQNGFVQNDKFRIKARTTDNGAPPMYREEFYTITVSPTLTIHQSA